MDFDIIIVGGGPAGLTAAIYLRRANKKVLVIERGLFGGQVATIGEIENYPGFLSVQGFELADIFHSQAKRLGVEFKRDEMTGLEANGEIKKVICKKGEFTAKAVILALGSMSRELNAPGEKEFRGSGVSYCATCDGAFFKGKDVAVVGSGDSAVASALYLQNICKSVHIISKYPSLKLKAYTPEIFNRLESVKIHYSSQVKSIRGEGVVQEIELDNEKEPLKIDGVFVTIGRKPDTEFLRGVVELDERGYIITDEKMQTSIKGVFACGDITVSRLKQIVTAVSQGAIAATEALESI